MFDCPESFLVSHAIFSKDINYAFQLAILAS